MRPSGDTILWSIVAIVIIAAGLIWIAQAIDI